MRAILLLALVAPLAAAASAYPDGAEWGASEARVPLRAEGALRVEADRPVRVALARPDEEPAAFASTPAALEAEPGAWRGLEGIVLLWLQRDAREPIVLELTDGAREGIALEWPEERRAPALHALSPLAVALALVASRPRP